MYSQLCQMWNRSPTPRSRSQPQHLTFLLFKQQPECKDGWRKKLLALLEKWLAWGDFARIACLQGWRLDVKRLLVKRWGIAQKRRLDSLLTNTEVKVAFKAPFSFPGGETTFSGDPIQIPVEDQLSLSSGWSRMRTKETKIWMTQRDLPH